MVQLLAVSAQVPSKHLIGVEVGQGQSTLARAHVLSGHKIGFVLGHVFEPEEEVEEQSAITAVHFPLEH